MIPDTITVKESIDLICTNKKKKWIGKGNEIHFDSELPKLIRHMDHPGRILLANHKNHNEVIEYAIDPDKKIWEEIEVYRLEVSKDKKTFRCVPLKNLQVPLPKKSQLEKSTSSRPRSYSNQSNRPRSNSNQLSPLGKSFSLPTTPEKSPNSSRYTSPHSSREQSPAPASSDLNAIFNSFRKRLNASEAAAIQKALWDIDGISYSEAELMDILKSSKQKNGHFFLPNQQNSYEICKYRIKETTDEDGKINKVWWAKKRYHLNVLLDEPSVVHFVELKNPDQSKQHLKASDTQVDLSKLVLESPSSASRSVSKFTMEPLKNLIKPSEILLSVNTNWDRSSLLYTNEFEQHTTTNLDYLSDLIPTSKMVNLDLELIYLMKPPSFLTAHPCIKSIPFITRVNNEFVGSTNIKEIVGRIGFQKRGYYLFLRNHKNTTGFNIYSIKGSTIHDHGLFFLYVSGPEKSPHAPLYIVPKNMSTERIRREGQPELFDEQWLETFRNSHGCIPYYELFKELEGFKRNGNKAKMPEIDEEHRRTSKIESKVLPYRYPIFEQVFTKNAREGLNIPIVFPEESQNEIDETSAYFYFKPYEKSSSHIVLVFCKQNEEPREIVYNIVAVEESHITLSFEYAYEKYNKRKQLIDLKILFELLVKKGLKPIHSLSEPDKDSDSEDNYNPFLNAKMDI